MNVFSSPPWLFDKETSRVLDATGAPVAQVLKWPAPQRQIANGTLIGSAPDMHLALIACVDALEFVRANTGETYRALQSAQMALAKAEGKDAS